MESLLYGSATYLLRYDRTLASLPHDPDASNKTGQLLLVRGIMDEIGSRAASCHARIQRGAYVAQQRKARAERAPEPPAACSLCNRLCNLSHQPAVNRNRVAFVSRAAYWMNCHVFLARRCETDVGGYLGRPTFCVLDSKMRYHLIFPVFLFLLESLNNLYTS